MKRVLVIGGGFSGIAALKVFSGFRKGLQITLIDKRNTSDFLPLLPDVLGRQINSRFLNFSLPKFCKRCGFRFIQSSVSSLDLDKKIIFTPAGNISYDYLLIASGSATNFYGNQLIEDKAYKLDDTSDATCLSSLLDAEDISSFVIAGGGYTGIEIATNLRRRFLKGRIDRKVIIVERASSILGPLEPWMKDYCLENLKRLDIGVFTNTSVEDVRGGEIILSSGKAIARAVLIWSAGVKTSDYISGLKNEKLSQGRLKVHKTLGAGNGCFVAGDAAGFMVNEKPLRMGVQFSIVQGRVAAMNIIASMKNKPLKEYKPVDLGYIIPMANNRSCGRILGFRVRGIAATVLHYLMCIYRSCSLRNKIGILSDLVRSHGRG